MRSITLALVLVLAFEASPAPRRRAVAHPVEDLLTITFSRGGAAEVGMIDLSTVPRPSAGRKSRSNGSMTETIGLLIERPSHAKGGTATVRVWLRDADPLCTIRIGAVQVTSVPQVLDRHAPIGTTVSYLLEAQLPPTAAAGTYLRSIEWEVEEN
jgi:hypothetical protein